MPDKQGTYAVSFDFKVVINMETASIPTERIMTWSRLEPAEDEVRLHPVELRAGMIVIADKYGYRAGRFFNPFYVPDESYDSTRASEWCKIVEYEFISASIGAYNVRAADVVKFVGLHADGELVNYRFILVKDTTEFIVKRDSIA